MFIFNIIGTFFFSIGISSSSLFGAILFYCCCQNQASCAVWSPLLIKGVVQKRGYDIVSVRL